MDATGSRGSLRYLPLAVAATPIAVWWLERLVALRSEGWFTGSTTFPVGTDFRTFHTAARLVADGGEGILYEAAAFRSVAGSGIDYGAFFYTPPFAVLLGPLGRLPFESAWVVWSVLSLAMLALGLKLLGTRNPTPIVLGALFFAPVYMTLTFGQASSLWLLLFAAAYWYLRSGRPVAAGIVAGLLILKPTMVIGMTLWWLVDWKRYRSSALAAGGSALVVLVLSELVLPGSFSGYVRLTWDYLVGGEPGAQWAQYSMWTFWDLLIPDNSWLTTIAGLVTVAVLIVLFARYARARPGLDLVFAAMVVMTVLVSPYMLAYEWTLLLIPAVLISRSERISSTGLLVGGGLVAAAATWSVVLAIKFLGSPGYTVQFAPLVLIGVVWWIARAIEGPSIEQAESVRPYPGRAETAAAESHPRSR